MNEGIKRKISDALICLEIYPKHSRVIITGRIAVFFRNHKGIISIIPNV